MNIKKVEEQDVVRPAKWWEALPRPVFTGEIERQKGFAAGTKGQDRSRSGDGRTATCCEMAISCTGSHKEGRFA